jgi:septal ring factor EnvC (AmiA/AmiB activator)
MVSMPSHVKSADEELAAIEQKQAKLAAKAKELRARQKEKEQQQEERRTLLVGGVVLNFMRTNPEHHLTVSLTELLDRHLTAAADRALFPLSNTNGIPPTAKDPASDEGSKSE